MTPKKHIKSSNYLTIQGWMITELNLKGNDLLVYALIYGFTQNHEEYFTGGLEYIAEWINCSKRGVQKNIDSLIEKGLIDKSTNGKSVKYKITDNTTMENNASKNSTDAEESSVSSTSAKSKKKYDEAVTMTETEYSNLCNKFGQAVANKCIEVLNNYKMASGKKYKSDYHAILNWVAGEVTLKFPNLTTVSSSGAGSSQMNENPFADIVDAG